MLTQIPHWRRLILPLGFALACVLLTIFVYRSFGGALPLEASGYRVEAPMERALNVVEGADVQISGVDVGTVIEVRRDGAGAVATLEIEEEFAPLRAGARSIVRTKTLLGEGYIEIAPGAVGAAAVHEGERLAEADPAIQLDEFLETFPAATRKRLRGVFAGVSEALDGRERDLSDALGSAAPAFAGLATVLDALDSQDDDLQRLVARSGDVLGALGEREGLLRAAVRNGEAVFATTASRDADLAATIRALPPFLGELRRTSGTVAAASGDLGAAVRALGPVAPVVRPALTAIEREAPAFRKLFEDLPATIAAGRRGLPALKRILDALPVAFGGLYPASRELIPLVDLLGDYRREALIGPLANGAAFTNGRIIGPGGRVLGRANGTATVWNESIGGYVKRLPTSRSNPYPKPGGLGELTRNGVLKSFDCRHTGNPLLVPPTGTGTPPCLTQGPWNYRGTTAFYPRLKLAAP